MGALLAELGLALLVLGVAAGLAYFAVVVARDLGGPYNQ